MLAGRRYRLEFTVGRASFAHEIAGICRSVWNTALEQRRAWSRRGASIGYAAQCAQLRRPRQISPGSQRHRPRCCSRRSGTWMRRCAGMAHGTCDGAPRTAGNPPSGFPPQGRSASNALPANGAEYDYQSLAGRVFAGPGHSTVSCARLRSASTADIGTFPFSWTMVSAHRRHIPAQRWESTEASRSPPRPPTENSTIGPSSHPEKPKGTDACSNNFPAHAQGRTGVRR